MAKQDEKQRLRKRLQDQAVELAADNKWNETIDINRQLITMGEDAETYNRLGKAYLEQGHYAEARDSYQSALRFNPANIIARKNLTRLESWFSQGGKEQVEGRETRQQVDLRMFITETGKTAITTLVDMPRNLITMMLKSGEQVELRPNGNIINVVNADGEVIGRLEPKLGQRLTELIAGGNEYIAAIAQSDSRQVRLLIRETHQAHEMRNRISFPGKLSEATQRTYVPNLRYEYESDDLLEEEEVADEREELEEDFGSGDEEELGLDDIEPDIGDEDENAEE